jgi:hypothetical protein
MAKDKIMHPAFEKEVMNDDLVDSDVESMVKVEGDIESEETSSRLLPTEAAIEHASSVSAL